MCSEEQLWPEQGRPSRAFLFQSKHRACAGTHLELAGI
jgi:hypothetical protein